MASLPLPRAQCSQADLFLQRVLITAVPNVALPGSLGKYLGHDETAQVADLVLTATWIGVSVEADSESRGARKLTRLLHRWVIVCLVQAAAGNPNSVLIQELQICEEERDPALGSG
ncbi:hypothetical protein IF2G_05412 [Cordyceps javanica]|nr:hypothetical protein IF2G_05412 [Cordyceps javanica]